jgi:hypothetical protein
MFKYIIPKCNSTYKKHANYKIYHWRGLIQRGAGPTILIIQETNISELIPRPSSYLPPSPLPPLRPEILKTTAVQ